MADPLDWAFTGTFYQVYPIGFCGAPHEQDHTPSHRITKLVGWADYLSGLGVSALLLNPVFQSSTHGYDSIDLRRVDDRLGSNEDLAGVVGAMHDAGVRVVLDAVFNHVGRDFWAFADVREHRWDSPYCDWFNISFDGDSNYGDGFWYEGWEGHFELVKLNLRNPAVVDYLLGCVRMWHDELGVDGLRLDVAYLLDRDFLVRLHDFCREMDPSFVLIGEVLNGDYNQIVNDRMLDSCTNYECYKGIWSSINEHNMFEISYSLNRMYGTEPWCLYTGKHLMGFVDNHDVERIASKLTNPAHLRIAYALLFGMPGMPCVYYGSEWGIEGTKGASDDWGLRPCLDEPAPNELTADITRLSGAHVGHPAFAYGSYRNVVVTNPQLVFERVCDGDRVLVAVNTADEDFTACDGSLTGTFQDVLGQTTLELDGQLTIPANDAMVLVSA